MDIVKEWATKETPVTDTSDNKIFPLHTIRSTLLWRGAFFSRSLYALPTSPESSVKKVISEGTPRRSGGPQ